ncbi:zinc finger protein 107-like [Cygnus olor]|uniref:zinc finger protein 107-like n=1 Tax=Cygnus olor TaxID=8869 RepID=UPI001ADE6542|nr:zinc finger protein 107-like [Cygnus olor]
MRSRAVMEAEQGLLAGSAERAGPGLGQEMAGLGPAGLGPAGLSPVVESESDVFEIMLPITILVLSDDDCLCNETEEQTVTVPELKKEDNQEAGFSTNILLEGDTAPSDASSGLSVSERKEIAANKDNCMKYSEEKWVDESLCNELMLSLSDQCDASKDKCNQNVLPTLPLKADLDEINETSDRKEYVDNDTCQKIPLLSAADSEGRDVTINTGEQMTLAVVCKDEEEHADVSNVLSAGSQEKQLEIPTEMEATVKVEDTDSSMNGSNEADNKPSKSGKFEAPSSVLEHGLKEEPEPTQSHSALFANRYSPTSEELLKDTGDLEMNASISAESNATEEHIYKSLTPFSKKRHQQQYIVSPHESLNEIQGQQEGLAWPSNSLNIKPFSEASCSINKHEKINLKCRFCSSVYKCAALLKRHVHSAHKDKKIHKCCFCKRTFFFSVNLKNHIKFHKKMTRLRKVRKNRMNARKVRQRRIEERKSETKKKESKYKKFFIKIERDFTSLGVPVIFSCRLCLFGSSNPRIFIHHMKGHKERPPYQCPQCDYSCISLSYMLNHMYWHAGYKLYKCRFCTFFSLYFASMVRHSYIHTGAKPYSCEFCQSAFTSTSGLKRHRRLHAGEGTCQGPQLDFVRERKRSRRPSKSYTCDECNIVFYTRGHLSFHKKFHEQFKVTDNGYTNQSNECKNEVCEFDCDSQDRVSISDKDNSLTGGMCKMLASEVDFEQADDEQDDKKMYSGNIFPESSHGSNTLPILGSRSEVLDSYKMDAVVCKEDPLLSPDSSQWQVKDGDWQAEDDDEDAAYYTSEDTWPSSLSVFKMYRCQYCDYATAVHSSFKLHLKMHTDEGPFVCQECNKTFKTSNHLQRHRLLHVENQYEFGSCLYMDSRLEENLGFHPEMHIGLCPERDFGSTEGSSAVHSVFGSEVYGEQTVIQRDEKNYSLAQSESQFYQCAECEYATYVLSNLKLHIRTHTGEKPYSCSVCQKKFRTSSHLKRHKMMHFNMEHLKCRKCDYSTDKWPSLKRHLALHSVSESSSAVCLYEQTPLPVKTYTCEECGYTTVRNSNFKQHLRIHTGEKPFECMQCGVAFRTSSHLKRHVLTHLKLYCRKCDFSTVDKRAFQKHAKAHKKKYKRSITSL